MNRQKTGYAVVGSLLAGMLVLLYCFDPARTSVFVPCPFYFITGFHCPGCGSLRSIHCLLHGNILSALSLNPLMVVSIPVLGLMLLNPPWIYKQWVPWTALCIVLCYGVVRNIPIWPFDLLAP